MPQALDSTIAYLRRSFPKFVSLLAGLAALLAPPSHVHSRTVKASQLVLPLLFGALAPGAEAFELPPPLPPCRGHDRIDYNSYGRTEDTGFPVGSAVKARFQGGDNWRLGTVEKVNTDGKLDVRYEDLGHLEKNVPVDRVRGVQP